MLFGTSFSLFHPAASVRNGKFNLLDTSLYLFIIIIILLFRAALEAYGGSQARGRIGTTAASLCHSHSNVGSELHLRPTPQLKATPDP